MYRCACEHVRIVASAHHPTSALSAAAAEQVARTMAALGTASRVRILAQLRQGESAVGDLADAVEMEQPAVSHQLRVLRDAGFVVGTRAGRHTVYALYDTHVAALVDEMLGHLDHVRTGATETTPPTHPGDTVSDTHAHEAPHTHEHSHGDETHAHPHTAHDHEHVSHDHDHPDGGGDSHAHPHVHQAGLETEHAHDA